MGFINKLFSAIGIEHASVDARLHVSAVSPGERLCGEIHLNGGTLNQQFRDFELVLMTKAERKSQHGGQLVTIPLQRVHINQSVAIQAGEHIRIPFEMHLPFHVPLSLGQVKVWLGTEAVLLMAPDPEDRDDVRVVAHAAQQMVLNAWEGMGFRLFRTENIYNPRLKARFRQRLYFHPNAEYRKRLKEIMISFQLSARKLTVEWSLIRIDGAQKTDRDDIVKQANATFTHAQLRNFAVPGLTEIFSDILRKSFDD